MLPSFQRAVRRKTISLVILLVLAGAALLFTPPSATGLFITAIVGTVLALGLLLVAYLPLGGGRQGTPPPSSEEQPPTAA